MTLGCLGVRIASCSARSWNCDGAAKCVRLEETWVCSASLLDHLLSNTHVIVFVKPVLSSLEVGASRVLGRLGCWGV